MPIVLEESPILEVRTDRTLDPTTFMIWRYGTRADTESRRTRTWLQWVGPRRAFEAESGKLFVDKGRLAQSR